MIKLVILALFFSMPLAGCATYQQYSQCALPVSGTVALMPFSSAAGTGAGQQAANWLAMELAGKGYTVIDSSLTTATVNETKFYGAGLNNEVRSALLAGKLTTLAFGSVNEFACETLRYVNLFGNPATKNRCTVSLTAKMVDTATGKLLWGLTLSNSAEGKDLTAGEVMSSLLHQADIADTLPTPLRTATAGELQPLEPVKSEPPKVEPVKAEPAKAEPAKVEPAKAEPAKVEPAKVEPAK